MLPDVELLVRLQGLDLRAAEYRKEIALLPKDIAVIERALVIHMKRLEADRASLTGTLKDRKAVDLEIQAQQQKIAKLRDQMTGAKTNEQFHAFQHEIAFCEDAVRKHEDRLVELMEKFELLERAVKDAEGRLREEKEDVARKKAEARARSAEDERKLAEVLAERSTITPQLSRTAALLYDKLSKRYAGAVISDATKGDCGSCHLVVRPQLFQELRKGDQILVCENCGRVLYYNPPVAFDEQVGAPAVAVADAAVAPPKRPSSLRTPVGPPGRRVDMT
jgi:predicted  nucleic acid-binding Zn-ribbon protein